MIHRLSLALASVAIVVGFLLLVFGGGLWDGVYVSAVRLALVVYGGVAVIVWLIYAQLRPVWLPRSELTGAFAAALFAFAIGGAAAAQPRLGYDYLAYAVLLTTLYLMLVRVWSHPVLGRRLMAAIVVTLVGSMVAYLAVMVSKWLAVAQQTGHLELPSLRGGYEGLWTGNPNAFASLIVLFSLTVMGGIGISTTRRKAAQVVLGIVVAFEVLLTGSRGAWLGVALAAAVALAVWLATPANRGRIRPLMRQRRAQLAAAVAVVGVVTFAVVFAPAIARRFDSDALLSRGPIWAATVRMIQDHPLLGIGPGSWPAARLSYTLASEVDVYVPHAHNVPLQIWAEFGIVGIGAAIVVAVLLLRLVFIGLQSASPTTRAFAWSSLLAVVYLTGQQLVDAYIHQPAILLAVALPIARLDSLVGQETPSASPSEVLRRRALAGMLLIAVVIGTAVAVSVEPAAAAEERATAAANAGEWPLAAANADRAAAADPRIATYLFTDGLAQANLGHLAQAEPLLAQSAALDDFPAAWVNLAAVRERLGDAIGARRALDAGMRLGIQQPPLAIAGADLYRRLGDTAAAQDVLAAAFMTIPSLAGDPHWREPVWSELAMGAAREASGRLEADWRGVLLALELGDMERATAVAADIDATRAEDAALAVRAWGGDMDAFAELRARTGARSDDTAIVALCSRVAAQLQELGETGATCRGLGSTDANPLVRIGAPTPGQRLPTRGGLYQAPFAYRRVAPDNLVVSWLPQLSKIDPS